MVDPPARPVGGKPDPLVQSELENRQIRRRIEDHARVALPAQGVKADRIGDRMKSRLLASSG